MEEATVKKEIVVKRLSAFKFAVEVNTNEDQQAVNRQTVIQRAPPAAVPPAAHTAATNTSGTCAPPPPSGPFLIRHAILQRIVEMLLWKLLGEKRLRSFCGYPVASACTLLRRVIRLSVAEARGSTSASKADAECNGSLACFLEQVAKFLEICAPSEDLWNRFGWNRLSEEAILRKIYEEELSPNLRAADLQQDTNIVRVSEDLQLLLQWERQGFTAVSWRQAGNHLTPVLPRSTWTERKIMPYHPGTALSSSQKVSLTTAEKVQTRGYPDGRPTTVDGVRGKMIAWGPRGDFNGRKKGMPGWSFRPVMDTSAHGKVMGWSPGVHTEWPNKPVVPSTTFKPPWTRHPRPYRFGPVHEYVIEPMQMRQGAAHCTPPKSVAIARHI